MEPRTAPLMRVDLTLSSDEEEERPPPKPKGGTAAPANTKVSEPPVVIDESDDSGSSLDWSDSDEYYARPAKKRPRKASPAAPVALVPLGPRPAPSSLLYAKPAYQDGSRVPRPKPKPAPLATPPRPAPRAYSPFDEDPFDEDYSFSPPPRSPPADPFLTERVERLPNSNFHYSTQPGRPLDPEHARQAAEIYGMFYRGATEGEAGYKIAAIEFLTVWGVLGKFDACRTKFQKEGRGTEMITVFHGTKPQNVAAIGREGFKIGGVDGIPALNGQAYGIGIYASTKPEAPIGYAFGSNAIIAADALPGRTATYGHKHGKHGRTVAHRMGPTSHEDSLHIPSSDWWVFKAPDQLCPRYVVYFEPTGRAVPGMAVVPPALAGGTGSSAYLANLLAQAKQKVATLGVPVPGLAAAPYGNLPYLAAGPSYAALPYAPPLPRPRKGKHRVPYLPAQLPPAAYQAPPPPTLPGAFPSSPPPRPRSPTPPAAAVPADVEAALSASLDDIQQPSHATPQATRAIQRQLMRIVASQMSARKEGEGGVVLDVEGMQNLYLWRVRFTNFDPNTSLARDLASIGRKHVDVELRFGPEYPERPPFIRVVAPRFVPLVNGGGGHVTAGGSVCYKKLTVGGDGKENWSPNTDLETLLLGIREGLLSGEPPARVDVRNPTGTYALNEAVAAYDRTIMMHAHQGWGRDGRMASWVYK